MRNITGNARLGVAAVLVLCGIVAVACGCAGSSSKATDEEIIRDSSEELRQSVTRNVEDQSRKDRMLSLVDQIESTQRDFSIRAAEFAAKYRAMDAAYDTPRAQFDQLFADFNTQRIRSRNRILDLHFQLAALATAQEWSRIGKAESDMYSEVRIARAEPPEGR